MRERKVLEINQLNKQMEYLIKPFLLTLQQNKLERSFFQASKIFGSKTRGSIFFATFG